MDKITIAICNFNTTKLTNDAIRSIAKYCIFDYRLIVFDNSDKFQFVIDDDLTSLDITILDNTASKYINFDKFIQTNKCQIVRRNNNASLKHAMSIQFLLDICLTEKMLLFDSDIQLISKIDFIDSTDITVADTEEYKHYCERLQTRDKLYMSKSRFVPFVQLFNIELIKQHHIRYFDVNRMHGGLTTIPYDTGASFFEDINKLRLKYRKIDYTKYIKHLCHGSWQI